MFNNVIDCLPNKASIKNAFERLYSKEFQSAIKNCVNPVGDGHSSKIMVKVCKNQKLGNILKKSFHDLKI
jgi:GDP/UDP-N,N'-diacetylbacillosamine 2-epimerase (hydrolysing)